MTTPRPPISLFMAVGANRGGKRGGKKKKAEKKKKEGEEEKSGVLHLVAFLPSQRSGVPLEGRGGRKKRCKERRKERGGPYLV